MEAVIYDATVERQVRLRFLATAISAFCRVNESSRRPLTLGLFVCIQRPNYDDPSGGLDNAAESSLLPGEAVDARLQLAKQDRSVLQRAIRRRFGAQRSVRVVEMEEGELVAAAAGGGKAPPSAPPKSGADKFVEDLVRQMPPQAAHVSIWLVAQFAPHNPGELKQVCSWQQALVQLQSTARGRTRWNKASRADQGPNARRTGEAATVVSDAPLRHADAIALSLANCPALLSDSSVSLATLLQGGPLPPLAQRSSKSNGARNHRAAHQVNLAPRDIVACRQRLRAVGNEREGLHGPLLLLLDITACVDSRPAPCAGWRPTGGQPRKRLRGDTTLDPSAIVLTPKNLSSGGLRGNVCYFVAYDAWLASLEGLPNAYHGSAARDLAVEPSMVPGRDAPPELPMRDERDDRAGEADFRAVFAARGLFSRVANELLRRVPLRICCGYGGSLERLVRSLELDNREPPPRHSASDLVLERSPPGSVVLRSMRDIHALLGVLLGDDRTEYLAEASTVISAVNKRLSRRGLLSAALELPQPLPSAREADEETSGLAPSLRKQKRAKRVITSAAPKSAASAAAALTTAEESTWVEDVQNL